jgi:2-keto-4-pentenoate hydratase/2-oxohepta-3-ene-1,7-dioic acid hydratase in catechol pathway
MSQVSMSGDYVIPAPPQTAIPVAGTGKSFPVRRVWCVGRNYLDHIRELGSRRSSSPSTPTWWWAMAQKSHFRR